MSDSKEIVLLFEGYNPEPFLSIGDPEKESCNDPANIIKNVTLQDEWTDTSINYNSCSNKKKLKLLTMKSFKLQRCLCQVHVPKRYSSLDLCYWGLVRNVAKSTRYEQQ